MATQSPEVKLPGKVFRKKNRWWWTVQLPGEKRPRSRALKPEGSRVATTDRRQAQKIAFAMWEQAVRADTEAKIKTQESVKIQRLKAKFQAQAKALTQLMNKAKAQAKTEASARAKIETELSRLRARPQRTTACHCCGRAATPQTLQQIDSGQRLCTTCLEALRREIRDQQGRRGSA